VGTHRKFLVTKLQSTGRLKRVTREGEFNYSARGIDVGARRADPMATDGDTLHGPPGTPDDVKITSQARKPETDPTLGIPVPPASSADTKHRLVTIGDSLTHGFQSLAISKTNLSWPAIVARELGLTGSEFLYPTYEHGGLPFNLEDCVRGLRAKVGRLDLGDSPLAVMWLLHYAHEIKHWWTHEADQAWRPPAGMSDNLAVYSYDVQTAYTRTLGEIKASIAQHVPGLFHPLTPHDVDRAARRVLVNADDNDTLLDVARRHGEDGGIETLVVALGSNNVLDVVIGLKYLWATGEQDRVHGRIWSPTFFAADWKGLVERVRTIKADHVILATVPHVTVVPIFAGVGNRLRLNSRYFQYYTHYWLRDSFAFGTDPCLTGAEARAIDSAIDQYNDTIVESVRQARSEGLDWYVLEMAGLLDRLASRRYLTNALARPSWWDDPDVGGGYPLPPPLDQLNPVPSTTFFEADAHGRTGGGLIALDGVHPTTIAYGILAQEVIRVMERAGVTFRDSQGAARQGPVDIDFGALLPEDTLVSQPPPTLTGDLHAVGWINKHIDLVATLMRRL
jgi:hypothetical protein